MLSAASAPGREGCLQVSHLECGGNRWLLVVPQCSRLFGGQPEAGVYAPASGSFMRFP